MSNPSKTFLGRPRRAPLVRGHVPTFTAKGKNLENRKAELVHWTRSSRAGMTGKVPDSQWLGDISAAEMDQAREVMRSTLPPLRKTSGQSKTRLLAKELHDWITEAMKATGGQWTPPRSLMGKIVEDSWRQGDPITYEDCYKMAMHQLERTKSQAPHLVPDVSRGTWEPSTTGR